jgi:uncharacterized protein (TIGR03067 family)
LEELPLSAMTAHRIALSAARGSESIFRKGAQMNRIVAVALLSASLGIGLVASADEPKGSVGKKELDKFQGTWELVADEWHGLTVLESSLKNDVETLAIRGERFTITWHEGHSRTKKPFSYVDEEQSGGTLQLDPTREPKEIDFLFTSGRLDGKTWRGIYRWDDGKLVVCLESNFVRPKEFKTATVPVKGYGGAIRSYKKR